MIYYYPGQKIETATHVKLQARACSTDHAAAPAGARLSQFFLARVVDSMHNTLSQLQIAADRACEVIYLLIRLARLDLHCWRHYEQRKKEECSQ